MKIFKEYMEFLQIRKDRDLYFGCFTLFAVGLVVFASVVFTIAAAVKWMLS